LKFQVKLEPSNRIEKEREKETFILIVTQLISKYGQEQFYYIKLIINMVENHHMITVKNLIHSYKSRLMLGNPESFDRCELECIVNSHLLIESCHSKYFRAKF